MTTSPSARRPHRHLLALPLFAAALFGLWQGARMQGGSGAFAASLVAQEDSASGGVLALTDVSVALEEGGRVESQSGSLFLREGAAVFKGASLVRVHWNENDLTGWNGAYAAAINGDTLTVVALTTPVLVHAGTQTVLVPIGKQWRSDASLASLENGVEAWLAARLPDAVLEEYMRDHIALAQTMQSGASTASRPLSPSWASVIPAFMQFAAARQRTEASLLVERLSWLQTAVETGNGPKARQLLQDPLVTSALSTTAEGRAALPTLLARDAASGDDLQAFLLPLVSDPDLWLLLSYHPVTQQLAWVQDAPAGASSDDSLLRTLLLPVSTETLPPSDDVTRRWSQALQDVLVAQKDPVVIVQASLPLVREHVAALRAEGFEGRAQSLALAYVSAVDATNGSLPDALRSQLADLRRLQPLPVGQKNDAIPGLSSAEAEALQRKAAVLLADIGATEVEGTRYSAQDGHTVLVHGLQFGGHPCDFRFDLKTDVMEDLSCGDTRYPLGVARDTFADWAARAL